MSKYKTLKIMGYIGASILGLAILILLVGVLFLKPWTERKITESINRNPQFPYSLTYADYDLSLSTRSVTFTDLVLTPKSDTLAVGVHLVGAKIEELRISGIGLYDLWRNNFSADKISLSTPHIAMRKGRSKPVDSPAKTPFKQLIRVNQLDLTAGRFQWEDSLGKQHLVYLENLDIQIDQIEIDSTSLKNKVPFRFADYRVSYDSLAAVVNRFYTLSTKKTRLDNDRLQLRELELKPVYSKEEFQKKIAKETDLFAVKNTDLQLDRFHWTLDQNGFKFTAAKLQLDSLTAEVYRNKAVADDTSIKPLFSKKLRDLNFFLALDTVIVKHSAIAYIEQLDFNTEASHIKFGAFNAQITQVLSGIAAKERKKKTQIDVDCLFMGTAPLKVHWNFDVNNTADQFVFSGSIHQLPTAKLNTFLRPQINATTTGTLDQVYFNIYGNQRESKGDFKIKYRDFKIEFLRKNGQKKNQFLSAIGNLFVRNDTDNTFNEAEIEQLRNEEKSFFNFMWISLADGLKKTFLVTNSKHSSKKKG